VPLDYVGRSVTAGRLLWNLGVISKRKTVENMLVTVSRRLHLDKFHLYLNLRDMQRVCVQNVAQASAQAVSVGLDTERIRELSAETL
jgi:hypothetical protein